MCGAAAGVPIRVAYGQAPMSGGEAVTDWAAAPSEGRVSGYSPNGQLVLDL